MNQSRVFKLVLAAGEWVFSLSVLDAETGAPMLVTGPDGQTSPQVGIGPVIVPTG